MQHAHDLSSSPCWFGRSRFKEEEGSAVADPSCTSAPACGQSEPDEGAGGTVDSLCI